MSEDAERAGDFEEPTPGSTGTRTEPPLRVGVWTDFDVAGATVGADDQGRVVPRARQPVAPDDADELDEAAEFDDVDELEDGVADADAMAAHDVDLDVSDATFAPGDAELPVFPPVVGPVEAVGAGQPVWPQPQLIPDAPVLPAPYPGFEAYANAFPAAVPPPGDAADAPHGRHGADERGEREHRDGGDGSRGTVGDAAAEPRRPRGAFETVFLFCVPALVLAGLVLYFGWARSAAISDYLGFDEEVLGYTAKEYLVRGIDALDRPMLAVFAVLLAVRMAHPRLVVHLRRHRRAAVRLSWVLRCAWFAVPATAWLVVLRRPEERAGHWSALLPGALAVGVLVSAYGVLISRQLGAHRRETGMGVRPWSLSVVLTASTVVLCLFWALGAYAETEGHATARRMVAELPKRTAVVVYSVRDLHVAGDQGVVVEALTGTEPARPDDAYKYRYSGLRLLRHDHGQLYLLPDRWSWDRPRLVVIRADSGVRVDYLRVR